jgi:hypothetical protein
MKAAGLMVTLAALLLCTAACGQVVGRLSGGASPRTAGALWSDVPVFAGARQVDLDMPLAVNMLIQAYVKSASNGDADLNYVVFTTEGTPADVSGFYTQQRMAGAGWNTPDNPGCAGKAGAVAGDGAMCIFGRRDGGRETVLLLIIARDADSKQTQLFYVRMSGSATPTASGGRG